MMSSGSQPAVSSARSCSYGASLRNLNGGRLEKILDWCGCGMRPVLRWSGTNTNPDRPFYGCPNYNSSERMWCGFFMWADGEEEQSLVGKTQPTSSDDSWKMNLAWRITSMEVEIRF
ncbi:Zinc finger GRF-type protein [Arachis hypogaea]|nr:Zinc finger GRF-type protein [Arachis hypogaea]